MKYEDLYIEAWEFDLIDSNMYLIHDAETAIVVDPCIHLGLPNLSSYRQIYIFLTHEHYDHISGVNWLIEKYKCTVIASSQCNKYINNSKLNSTKFFSLLLIADKEKNREAKRRIREQYKCRVDVTFDNYMEISFGNHRMLFCYTPGHSPGSAIMSIDNILLFVGDSLLGNGMELKSINSSKEEYERYVLTYISSFSKEAFVFPGHGQSNRLECFLERLCC